MPEPQDIRVKKFEDFLGILRTATANVSPDYFMLEVAGVEGPIYRERDYCYELYHLLREIMPDDFGYNIHGEVDKTKHPIIAESVGKVKPDYIVHVPGTMERNLVVIEVKPIVGDRAGILKDIRNLCGFLTKANYFRAILMVYGDDTKLIERIMNLVQEDVKEIPPESFYLIWHRQSGGPAEIIWVSQ